MGQSYSAQSLFPSSGSVSLVGRYSRLYIGYDGCRRTPDQVHVGPFGHSHTLSELPKLHQLVNCCETAAAAQAFLLKL